MAYRQINRVFDSQCGTTVASAPDARKWVFGVTEVPEPAPKPSPGWIGTFRAIVQEAAEYAQSKKLDLIQSQVSVLSRRVEGLASSNALVVPINTFAPLPYEPIKEIRIVVEPTEDGFCASLYDANLSTCGETEADAIQALKEYIVEAFELLERLPKLGPGPSRQLAVLRSLIQKTQL
jgi:hypothetical protein